MESDPSLGTRRSNTLRLVCCTNHFLRERKSEEPPCTPLPNGHFTPPEEYKPLSYIFPKLTMYLLEHRTVIKHYGQ